jgi:hypothetical protein
VFLTEPFVDAQPADIIINKTARMAIAAINFKINILLCADFIFKLQPIILTPRL